MKTHCCWRKNRIPLVFILLLVALQVRGMIPAGPPSPGWETAQPEQSQDHFHLMVFGDHLETENLQISLKTNPGYGEEWQKLGRQRGEVSQNGQFLKYSDFSLEEYFGHDIRENYLPLRISRQGDGSESGKGSRGAAKSPEKESIKIRAVYVVAADGEASGWSWTQWKEKITGDPAAVKALSLASHVRPRPRSLAPGD
ncbi:MAG: hypothetical protein KGY60_04055, partial [Bacteroidales bacterium]|nr:hypothetical protein [Bacteroidales bacterium]